MSTDVVADQPPGSSAPDLSEARAIVRAVVADGTLPCAVFGIADAGGILGTVAVDGPDTRVDEDSIFFLASIAKPIVATAVMRYVDEGRLDLHAPLRDYLPEFDGAGREAVTAWHVLTHTSGLPDMPVEELFSRRPSYETALAEALARRPEHQPGTVFRYASSAFLLLAEIMARSSGVRFARALEMRITGPLGMRDTTFDPRYDRRRAVSLRGLQIDNRVIEEVMLRFLARATLPGGGMFGTLSDLLRFGRALLPRPSSAGRSAPDAAEPTRVLSAHAIAEMGRLHTAGLMEEQEDGTWAPVRFGLGWAKPSDRMPGTPSAFTHGGAAGGRIWVDPDADLTFAFLTNLWGAPSDLVYEVLEAIYRARG